jgi:hypothetical protein
VRDLNQEGRDMITQGKLPFKLEITDEEITPRSGLALYAEVLRAFRIEDGVEEHLLQPGSNRGYKPWRFVEPLLLMLYGGGCHIEDLREIRDDVALRRLIGLEEMPSLSTFGDWLSRCGEKSGVEGIGRVNGDVARRIFRKDQTQRYTLDVDATVIEAEKQGAEWTYKRVKGYQPILGFIAENGVCLSYEFREGNVVAGARAVDFLEECERVLPEGKEMSTIRSDSAFYQAEVLNWCEKRGKSYTITAGKDKGVLEAIATVRDWKKLRTLEGEEMDREVGTAIHIMAKTEQAFRLVVQRWKNAQRDLFKAEDWSYHVIATNLDDLTAEEVVWWHNQRGQAENFIKELKSGFGMEQMPSGVFEANALYFGLGVLAYNTAQALKLFFLDKEWRRHTIGTLRWRLVEIAGKVIRHGRQLILKLAVPLEKLEVLLRIRELCLEFG